MSCCGCSMFAWQDDRQYIDNKRAKKSLLAPRKVLFGSVTSKTTGITYRKLQGTDCDIRWTCFGLFIGIAPITVALRMPYRTVTLLTGDFFRAGYQLAEREWRLVRQTAKKAGQPEPSQCRRYLLVMKHSLWQLAKNIAKIVTYPIAAIAMTFAAFYGLVFHPLDGKAMYSTVENLWARDLIDVTHKSESQLRIGDYLALCMVSQDVWDQQNFYRTFDGYDPEDYRSLQHDIILEIKNNREFLVREFGEKDVKELETLIQSTKEASISESMHETLVDFFRPMKTHLMKVLDNGAPLRVLINDWGSCIRAIVRKDLRQNFECSLNFLKEDFTKNPSPGLQKYLSSIPAIDYIQIHTPKLLEAAQKFTKVATKGGSLRCEKDPLLTEFLAAAHNFHRVSKSIKETLDDLERGKEAWRRVQETVAQLLKALEKSEAERKARSAAP